MVLVFITILDKLFQLIMKHFCKTVVGSSHEDTKLPCQDSTLCKVFDKGCIIAVSDGHGGRTYVRSHIGSDLACSIAIDLTRQFVLDNYKKLSTIGRKSHTPDDGKKADSLFLDLFTRIHEQWYDAIMENVANTPFTNEEIVKLGDAEIKEAFGCTLIVAVKTDSFTFAFHIGDGRIYTISYNNEWKQPVPWDSACEDNITTSLCESNPVDRFRYYVDSSDNQPFAIFACSDGIEDCYGGSHDGNFQSEKLVVDYSEVIRAYLQDKESDFNTDCESFLKNQSESLSHDDMSIAFVIDDRFQLQQDWLKIVESQRLIFEVAEKYKSYEIQVSQLSDRLKTIESNISNYKKELNETQQNLEFKKKERATKQNKLLSETLCKDSAVKFNAKIILFQQDIQNYCASYEKKESEEVSQDVKSEVLTFKKKLTGYILKAVERALKVIRADIMQKQENVKNLNSEIEELDKEIQKLEEKEKSQEESLKAEKNKFNQIKKQEEELIGKKVKCEEKKKEVEKNAESINQSLNKTIKEKIPYEEVENCLDSSEKVYNTLNISKKSFNEKDEDFNMVILSSNSIEVTYSGNINPYYIGMDDFDELIKLIKGIDPAIFSSDENLSNNCITVLFLKKDGNCITKTINIEKKEAQEIWGVCTNIYSAKTR